MKSFAVTIFILAIAAVSHGLNMFNFPYYENDEGVYLSQAWSVINQGQLAPYTYWYDHAPVGWLFTALWLVITKSVYLFGFSLNSGRVFMLIIHVLSSWILLKIGKKITGSFFAGSVAVVLFSLSPLGIYFQRRLLLDNLMIFWVLLAFYFAIKKASSLSHILISGVLLGIAILTKENAIFFLPGFLATIWFCSHEHHRKIAVLHWLFLVAAVVSTYFLYAVLKGEFFPYGTPVVGGKTEHVSLLTTLKYQYSRKGGSITNEKSSIRHNLDLWTKQDGFLLVVGIAANSIVFFYGLVRDKRYLGLALFGLFFCWFLVRGGIVIEFYVVPLIPLFAIYIGLSTYLLLKRLGWVTQTLVFVGVLAFGIYKAQYSWAFAQGTAGYRIFQSPQTKGQIDSLDWIYSHVPEDAFIVIDNYAWLQLNDPKNPSGRVYPNAHWYWKIDQDPAVRDTLLARDPSRIDFIAKTPQMTGDLSMGMSETTQAALANSRYVTGFSSDGWGVEIWATQYPKQILSRSWDYYKSKFLQSGEQSIDPNSKNRTTSEGQSYALLRSVWLNDFATFSKVWQWTKKNLQKPDGTFAWNLTDTGSASDADVDIAMALLLAEKKWPDHNYLAEAKLVMSGIWSSEVGNYSGTNYLLPGNWAKSKPQALLNPSYFSPVAFRMFAQVDDIHPWLTLVDSSYKALTACTKSALDRNKSVLLPPNWCVIDASGTPTAPLEEGTNSTEYSYDAVRVMWRVALDYQWYADPRAKAYLELTSKFLTDRWLRDQKILVGYTHDGQEWEKYESPVGYSAALSNFSVTNPDLATQIYDTKIKPKFYEDFQDLGSKSYWEDENNYYTQNWTWFATALYSDQLTLD